MTNRLFLYLVRMNIICKMRFSALLLSVVFVQFSILGQHSADSEPMLPDSLKKTVLGAFDGTAPVDDSVRLQYIMTFGSFPDENRVCFSIDQQANCCFDIKVDSLFQTFLSSNVNSYWAYKLYGDFLFKIFEANRFSKSDDAFDVARRMNHNYSLAWQNGAWDAHSLYALGYFCSLMERYSEAVQWYLKSLEMDASNALVNYSLGVSFLLDKNSLAAQPYALNAVSLFADLAQKSDAARIAGITLYENGHFDTAYRYFSMADSLSPGYLLNQTFLLRSMLQQRNDDEAIRMANTIYEASPHSPDVADRIYELFRIANRKELYLKHVQDMVVLFAKDDEASGNLKFHFGKMLYLAGEQRKALRMFDQAKVHFKKVLPPNHQVFEALEDMPGHKR